MKKYLLLLVVSSSSFACPQLAGLYSNCTQSDGSKTKVRIVQTLKNGVDVFKVDWARQRTYLYEADGVARETAIFETGMVLKKTSFCEADVLHHAALMTTREGTVKLDITQEYSKQNGKLRFVARDAEGVYNEVVCR